MEIRDVNMDFVYGGSFTESSPEAYERLILDVLLGDPPLFPRHEEVELSWQILDPILDFWGRKGKPEAYPSGGWGPESAAEDAGPRRTRLEATMMIALTDTDSAGIAAEFMRARSRAGSPAMGMVLTMVVVADEDDADRAMEMAREASHEHPARVLGVILGDARGASQVDAQVGTGSGWTGETALIRLTGEVVKHPDSVVLPLLLPDSPVAVWWPTDPPVDPASDPLGLLAQRRITDSANVSRGRAKALRGQCRAYTPGQHRPRLDPAHAVAGAAGGRTRPAPAQGQRRPR